MSTSFVIPNSFWEQISHLFTISCNHECLLVISGKKKKPGENIITSRFDYHILAKTFTPCVVLSFTPTFYNKFGHINVHLNLRLSDEYFHDGEFLSSQMENVFCGDPVTA